MTDKRLTVGRIEQLTTNPKPRIPAMPKTETQLDYVPAEIYDIRVTIRPATKDFRDPVMVAFKLTGEQLNATGTLEHYAKHLIRDHIKSELRKDND